jgi:hypothetical protein
VKRAFTGQRKKARPGRIAAKRRNQAGNGPLTEVRERSQTWEGANAIVQTDSKVFTKDCVPGTLPGNTPSCNSNGIQRNARSYLSVVSLRRR